MPIEVNHDNFAREVIQAEKLVVIDFWGPRCVPCLALNPQVESLEKVYGEQVKIAKVDSSKNRRLCLELKVLGLPTFLFFKDGAEVGRLTGEKLKIQEIEEVLKKNL
jgi:thioredoxin 1